MRAAVLRDGFWNGEMRLRNRAGRILVVDHHVTLVRDDRGRASARLSFLVDVTEKKLLEEKLLRAQRLENIGMLAAGIAHDLNNVLTPIIFAEPLLRESLTNPRDLKILSTVKQCAARGAGLVKHILGFARGAAGEFQPILMKHIVRDVMGVVEETFPKSIEIQKDVPSDLWSVKGNATQVHQVLLNLCVNARDAMPNGGTLRVSAANRRIEAAQAGSIPGSRPGAWVAIEVADTGTGIPPDVLENIWTPFFSTKGVGTGTGLGLSTVQGIVTSHRGFVDLQTSVNHGTTFRVFLPADESKLPQTSSASPFDVPEGQGELILLVDDDSAIRNVGAAILGRHGYHVVTSVDGVEAIASFIDRAQEFSLVITDIDMPHMGGTELARALLLIRPDIRILAMSGIPSKESDPTNVLAAKQVVHGFLAKPFQVSDLLGTVHRLLNPAAKP
jgi:signal transduction histidine kinase/ActR/RegA family two-component response regulator